MDELLELWTETYDAMMRESEPIRRVIEQANSQLQALEAPYLARLDEIHAEIRPLAEALGKTYEGHTAIVKYRKGAIRITYDWRKVDSVCDFLRDVLPETAVSLHAARSESIGEPSINIVRL